MDDKQKIAQIDSEAPIGGLGAVIRYQLSDHLGSASLELDENADIISYEEYYPFGTTSYRNGRNEVDVSLKRYKYVMKELDNETGLYYYGMRYYAIWIAKFISVDPLQHKYTELTPFQYASNRPISGIDLDGAEFDNVVDEYQKNIVEGTEILSSIDFGFPSNTGMYNKKYWKAIKTGEIVLKDNKKPAKAVNDIIKNPSSYSADCAQFVQLVNWYARYTTYGKKAFNDLNKNNEVFIFDNYSATGNITETFYSRSTPDGEWIDVVADNIEQERLDELIEKEGLANANTILSQYTAPTVDLDVEQVLAELPIGSRVMIGNIDIENTKGTAWKNENMIKIGDDKYYAHPFGSFSLDEIKYKFAREVTIRREPPEEPNEDYIKNNIFIKHIETYRQEP